MSEIKITREVAKYIMEQATKYIRHGWGDRDVDGMYGPGLIDNIPGDTEAYRYVSHMLGFLRFVSGILRRAILDEDLAGISPLHLEDIDTAGDNEF